VSSATSTCAAQPTKRAIPARNPAILSEVFMVDILSVQLTSMGVLHADAARATLLC
jgi:hypothetical protein